MKATALLTIATAALIFVSCDAYEDQSKRDDYENAGDPISSTELTAALSVTQLPNVDGEVAGDQYIIVKNNRPDIGGTWRLKRDETESTYPSDNDTIIASSNGDYTLTYVGISANQRVESKPFNITVTNVFDTYDRYLTGANDKSDRNAKKTWRFRRVSWGSYCNMGAYGGWIYTSAGYTPESNFMWWNNQDDLNVIGNQSMVLSYDGNTAVTYEPDGVTIRRQGTFSYNHNEPDDLVKGELTMSVPAMGCEYDDGLVSRTNVVYWILTIDDNYLTLFHPNTYTGGVDWSDWGWYVYYECE